MLKTVEHYAMGSMNYFLLREMFNCNNLNGDGELLERVSEEVDIWVDQLNRLTEIPEDLQRIFFTELVEGDYCANLSKDQVGNLVCAKLSSYPNVRDCYLQFVQQIFNQ